MSDMDLEIRWKAVAVLSNEPPIHQENVLFNKGYKVGLYSQFDIDLSLCYVPILLFPTITYHQVMHNLLGSHGVNIENKNFPYKIEIEGIGECKFNLQIKLYLPSIVCLTITISSIKCTDIIQDVDKLIDLQHLDQLSPINSVLTWTLSMIETMNHRKFGPSVPIRARPGMYLYGVCETEQFSQHLAQNLHKYVGILIRNRSYQNMSSKIVKKVIDKNKSQNLKDQNELLLIDKQGLLFVVPTGYSFIKREHKNRFLRAFDLYEIAMVFRALLDKYSEIRFRNEDFCVFR